MIERLKYVIVMLLLITLGRGMAFAQFNPENPPEPNTYVKIKVSANPANAAYVYGAGEYTEGTQVTIRLSTRNSNYVFQYWTRNGEKYSEKTSFTYTVGKENVSFVAVYKFNPSNPAEPEVDRRYELYLTASPAASCSFNRTNGAKVKAGESVYVNAYSNNGYDFLGWYDGETLVSATKSFYYTMPYRVTTLIAKHRYNPGSPSDPAGGEGDIDMGVLVTDVVLDKTSLSIFVGNTHTLFATVLPDSASNKTVTWTTSNASVATVDANGVVTGVADGQAVITAKAGNASASCEVNVDVPYNIHFLDDKVKELCVANWDTNGDGELSTAEAAAVTDIGSVFQNNQQIYRFNELQYFSGLTSICSNAFSGCSNLLSLTLPESITSIGSSAFSDCKGLVTINIPKGVKSIGDFAFIFCPGLKSIYVDSGNEVYDSRDNCNAIIETATNTLVTGCANTNIPNGVVKIGDEAFYGCSSLTSLSIPNSVTHIEMLAFCMTGLTSVTIPNGVTTIDIYAFGGCSDLTSVVISNSVSSINDYAFLQCENLESIIVDSANEVYDSRNNSNAIIETATNTLLVGCRNTIIPNGVVNIGWSAFSECKGLTSIIIPASVTNISGDAFNGCSDLISVTIENKTPIAISQNTFSNRTNATLYVPAGSKAAYEAADYWKEFKEIVEVKPTSATITINEYGCGTYCSEYALDFTDVEGMKAYVGVGFKTKTSTLMMSPIKTVKAGVGLYIKGEPGEYQIPTIDESYENYINLMVGTLSEICVGPMTNDGKYTNYNYTMKDGDTAPKFYLFGSSATLGANKAYLQLPTDWLPGISTSKTINIAFEDEDVTGIDEFVGDSPNGEAIVYDMLGRRVVNPSKGLYIVNGKKVLIK